MNSEKDIKKEAKQLAKENNWDKLHLRSKFESENRTEEAAIVSKLIHEEEADEVREYMVFNQFIFLLPFFKFMHSCC
jgi:hypothetical protein